jgi:hypothetical protein
MERLLPEYQYMPYTTETTKALGHLIGTVPSMHGSSFASPLVIENYVRQWSGGLGMYALQIADAALRKTGVLPDPIRPASTLSDIPFQRRLRSRYRTFTTVIARPPRSGPASSTSPSKAM